MLEFIWRSELSVVWRMKFDMTWYNEWITVTNYKLLTIALILYFGAWYLLV